MSESYPFEFVLILFEDSAGFEHFVNICFHCLPVYWCITDQAINVNQMHNLPQLRSKTHGSV